MPTFFRVTDIGTMYGQQHQNVLHFAGPSSDPLQMSALADEFTATWVTQMKGGQSQAYVHSQIKVRMLESQFPPFIKTINLAGANQFDDELFTPTAFVIRLRTDFVGRQGRGRIYLGGVNKGWTTNGLVDADVITSFNNRFATILGQFGLGGASAFDLVVLPHNPPFSVRNVTSMQLAPTLGVQRRRNIGIGV